MTTIKVARDRVAGYTVNYDGSGTGNVKSYNWTGSKGNRIDIKAIPEEVIEWLNMNSVCFKEGELRIIEDTKEAKEVVSNIDNVDEYKTNAISKEEVIKILQGNINKMKSELKKITNKDTKQFVVEVAKEINLDSNAKLTFLAEWIDVPKDILFED